MEAPNWAEQLKSIIDRYPLFVLLSIVAALIGYATTIHQIVGALIALYTKHIGWKRYEERIINSLLPGTEIGRFEDVLGKRIFRNPSSKGYTEFVFQRRAYWVQAIANEEDTVVLIAVTSSDDKFKPTIRNNPAGAPIRLMQTTFRAVAGSRIPELHYSVGVTASTYFIEELYLGNPSHYQTVFWGFNDAGGFNLPDDDITRNFTSYVGKRGGDVSITAPEVDAFRTQTAINTFAVTAPGANTNEILQAFHVGVDRVQVRTVPLT